MTIGEDLRNIYLPSRCVICNKYPKPLCDDCLSKLPITARQVIRADLVGNAVSVYRDDIATCINAFKERGQRGLAKTFANLIADNLPRPEATAIAAAPSGSNRGFVPAEEIGKAIGRIWDLPLVRLRIRPGGNDQTELTRRQRIENMTGRIWSPTPMIGERVLLVDDVITTGGTMREMARAVEAAGGVVVGFITVAETLPKTQTKF